MMFVSISFCFPALLSFTEDFQIKDLILVGEVLGPAIPKGSTTDEIESLPVAPVFLERRRIDKQGRVKQKLSVVGVRCIDCAVCLTRFKVGEMAVALPKCLHVFVDFIQTLFTRY